jgi:hypothetical protein
MRERMGETREKLEREKLEGERERMREIAVETVVFLNTYSVFSMQMVLFPHDEQFSSSFFIQFYSVSLILSQFSLLSLDKQKPGKHVIFNRYFIFSRFSFNVFLYFLFFSLILSLSLSHSFSLLVLLLFFLFLSMLW